MRLSSEVKVREWRDYDLDYWGKFGISLPWLKFAEVYPVSQVFITKGDKNFIIPADKYAYVYVEKKSGEVSLKVYQPLSTTHKWINKHDSSVWSLWNQLPKQGEYLIITSSLKDSLCIWENTGIPACSLQAESYLPKEHVVRKLKSRFKKIFVLYDNDFTKEVNYGRLYGAHIAKELGLIQIELPEALGAKDSSDLYSLRGKEVLVKTIKELVTKV